MKSKWFDCVKQPSETGKKVLCCRRGDFYVAVRIKNCYIPMPFADHYFSPDLCFPELWSEIDFPEPYTGIYRVAPKGDINSSIALSECEIDYPEIFKEFCEIIMGSIGKLKIND